MEEIKVNEYVRTECGIAKIKEIEIKKEVYELDKDIMYIHVENWQSTCTKSQIIKHSLNIIDLIEEGDYVNGNKVISIFDNSVIIDNFAMGKLIYKDEIKSIVTKEQYKQIEYRLEEQ